MSEENPTFTIKRKYVLGLGKWLNNLSLIGRESRERTKFVEELSSEVKENEEMRMEVLKKYAKKDEKGELIMVEAEGSSHYDVDDEVMPKFAEEMQAYLDEDFVVSGEGTKNRLKTVKSIVLDTTEKISPEVAAEYSIWCDAFEKVEV